MSERGHEQHHQDVGAYLLGSLSEIEATAFKRHHMRCERCANELERLTVAVDALPRAVEPVEPPPSLKPALMQIVRREAPAPAAAAPAERVRPARRSAWSLLRLRPAAAVMAAALLLAAGGALGFGLAALDRDPDQGGARTLAADVDRARLPGVSARLVVPPAGRSDPILRVEGLAQPPKDRVYQLWLLRGQQPVPAGLLAVQADGTGRTALTGDLTRAQAVLVTREREGGAPAPTEVPLMRVPLG